jgi:hypothetical protein
MLLAKLVYKKKILTRMIFLSYDQINVPVIYNCRKYKENLKFQNAATL